MTVTAIVKIDRGNSMMVDLPAIVRRSNGDATIGAIATSLVSVGIFQKTVARVVQWKNSNDGELLQKVVLYPESNRKETILGVSDATFETLVKLAENGWDAVLVHAMQDDDKWVVEQTGGNE